MRKAVKMASVALASLLAAGVFAGCGGDQKAASSKAAAADGKTSVKLVLSSTERPLSWADENGKLQGYEYDIWQEVNKNLKDYHLDIQAVPPETQDVMMESGDAKVASGGYYRTPRREKDYIVPKTPIGVSSVMVYMSKDNAQKYHSLEDVIKGGGKLVPNTPNGGIYKVLTDWNAAHDNIMKEVPIQDGLTPAERITSLKNGQYDALVYPNNLGVEDIAKAMNFEIVALDKPIKVNKTVVIVNKNEQKLADEIEAALEKMSKDGTLQKISEKWYHKNLFDQLKDAGK
ncbi:transporter substrate-binding domain-containing protein [uncultured Dialister sp.]|uniref:transporter substrate-binding domain-containing protein n=1 Tax=uncultured Dialister sp. TaxID=278064 RepID=UPI0025F31ABB|nr:transporter substrate-binding domain-containing protein [uncultured Dialister sp.]